MGEVKKLLSDGAFLTRFLPLSHSSTSGSHSCPWWEQVHDRLKVGPVLGHPLHLRHTDTMRHASHIRDLELLPGGHHFLPTRQRELKAVVVAPVHTLAHIVDKQVACILVLAQGVHIVFVP